MSHERLTRHELTWLLAQEARGAAKSLRDEVVRVQRPGLSEPPPEPVETTLDALDDAIEMLSALNTGSRGQKARRGRIDLAALLFEVAPKARIAIEPGAGTEVFGDEADLRRMVNLLVTQAAGSQTEVQIRRRGDWVKISVDLGPDVAAVGELERRWLSRMATRHGGWFELEGGTQSILLQADGASDQREVTELRKELKQAQQLGEAYARELAAALGGGELHSEPPPPAPHASSRLGLAALRGAAAAFERVCRLNAESLRADAALVGKLSSGHELAQNITRRANALSEFASELAGLNECPLDAQPSMLDFSRICRSALAEQQARALRREVTIESSIAEALTLDLPEPHVALLVHELLVHAIAATPRGGVVCVSAFRTELGTRLSVEDGGPPVPETARLDILGHTTDPTSLGRPAGVSLLVANVVATALGSELELREGPRGTEVSVAFPM